MKKSSKILWIALTLVVTLVAMSFSAMAAAETPAIASDSENAASDFAETISANKVYATQGADMIYDDSVTVSAEAFLHDAIIASEEDGGKVINVVLRKTMQFTVDANIGTAGATHNGQVNVYSEVSGTATPTIGIYLKDDVVLNFFGNINFDNLAFSRPRNTSFSSGACLNFCEGLGTIGHAETSEGSGDWGNVVNVVNTDQYTRLHLSGSVTVYTGSFWTVSGNFYNSGATNNNVNITLAGNSVAYEVYGGKHNNKENIITGTTTLKVLNSASVTSFLCGGNRNTSGTGYVPTDVVINTTGTVSKIFAGSYINNQNADYENKRFTLTIENVNCNGTLSIQRMTSGTTKNMNFYVNVKGGQYSGTVFIGAYINESVEAMAFSGNITVDFRGGTFTNNVYTGGYNHWTGSTGVDKPHNITDSATRTINIYNGAQFGNIYGHYMGKVHNGGINRITGTTTYNLYGGTISSKFFAGAYINNAACSFSNSSGSTVAKTIVNVYDGFAFNNLAPNFTAGAFINADNVTYNGDAELNFFGGSFPQRKDNSSTYNYYIFGGSELTRGGAVHSGKVVINLAGGTFSNNGIYGGSYITGANAKHTGDIEINVTAMNITGTLYSGSFLNSTTSVHSGKVVTTLQGTEGKLITAGNHIAGGSNLNVDGSKHTGDSTIYLKDIYTATVSSIGITQNLNMTGGYIFGGSQGTKKGTHSGDSQVIIQRTYFNLTGRQIYGGSRLDDIAAYHTGTSKVIVDANTSIVDGVEKTGSGWNYIKVKIYGGSHLNGYLANATESASNQTGNSSVELIAPTARGEEINTRLTVETTAPSKVHTDQRIVGGNYLSTKITVGQVGSSSVIIKGKIDYVTYAPNIYAGSEYTSAKTLTYTATPSMQIIIEGEYPGTLVAGCAAGLESGTKSYQANTAIIVKKGGTIVGDVYIGSLANNATNATLNQTGVALFEVYDGALVDGTTVALKAQKGSFTSIGLKLIGSFPDKNTDSNSDYNLYFLSGVKFTHLDIVQYTGATCSPTQYTVEDGVITTNTTKAYTTLIERINSIKNVFFVDASSTRTNYTEIAVNPTMKIADLLATEGLQILTNYDPKKSSTNYPFINKYADITKYDAVSLTPNAYEFYAVNEDGTRGAKLEYIPADPTQKFMIVSGTVYSYGTYFNHVFEVANKSVSLASNLIMNYKVSQELETLYGYTITHATVSFAGQTDTIYYEAELDNGRYVFKFTDIAPNGIADEMIVTIYATYGEDEVVVASRPLSFGVMDYCYEALSIYAEDQDTCTLIVDLLNYGAAAQQYTNHNVENLANAKLTDEQKALATPDSEIANLNNLKDTDYTTIANATATIAPSLTLANSIMVRYRVTLAAGTSLENVSLVVVNASDENRTWTLTGEAFVSTGNADEYYVYVPYLNADQVSDELYATVYENGNAISNTCRYTVESYAAAAAATTADEYASLRALAAAMIKYGKAAAAYGA